MRSRGTKEIVPSLDGRSFIALLESGELWRHDTLLHVWVRVLNPDEMAAERAEEEAKKAAEAPKTAQEAAEDQSYATVSISEADRLTALSLAHRLAGGVATTDHMMRLARWVIAKFERRDR